LQKRLTTKRRAPRVRADAAIVVEPTELRLAVSHRGFVGFELETAGVAAHGSRPDLGIDARRRRSIRSSSSSAALPGGTSTPACHFGPTLRS
jgi:acetylornithine deacetylase/succinyl-diaminopimelate desuccinylase-like protein